MADPTETSKLVIQLGDGATPTEGFAFTAGANSQEVSLTNNLGENTVLDTDDPLGVNAVITRHLESQDTSVQLAGIVSTEAWDTWRQWADDATAKNVKIFLDEAAGVGGGHWVVPAMIGNLQLTKTGSKTIEFTAQISGAGRRVWTAAT